MKEEDDDLLATLGNTMPMELPMLRSLSSFTMQSILATSVITPSVKA